MLIKRVRSGPVIAGSGVVRRMWITLRPRDPKILRALRVEMFWDGSDGRGPARVALLTC